MTESPRNAPLFPYTTLFRSALDPDTQVLPANGSKEAVFNVHLALVDPEGPRRKVVIPTPAYPVYERADRKSTRLNSSHSQTAYAVLCLKKKRAYACLPASPR